LRTTATVPVTSTPTTTEAIVGETLLAAGDIGACDSGGDEQTAALIDEREGTVAALGDTAYERGTAAEFARCYEPTWGRFKDRTRPAVGNHEYATLNASGYYAYFGAAAGRAGQGWYSYELGDWHVVVLNSNCENVGCAAAGAQGRWLRSDLAAHPARCTLAYWHHPRFSSGIHGSEEPLAELFTMLYDAGVDVVLAAHDHDYERFAPLNAAGVPDPERGVRTFVVGTGGKSFYPIFGQLPGSEVRIDESFGILELTLGADAYQWEFVPVPGRDVHDAGTGTCH
jgi:hypothetical protein